MHAIRHPVITRVDVRKEECRLDLAFPDDVGALRFGHVAAALLDQDVDVDIAPTAGTERRRAESDEAPPAASTPDDAEMLARGIRHDLQGPLTAVRSYLDLALDEAGDEVPAEVRSHLEEAVEGTHRLQAMVEGVGRLATESRVGGRRPVDLDATLDDALANLGPQLGGRRATVERGSLPTVEGDAGSLVRVLQNLVGNALDHVAGPVTVRVDARREPGSWRVHVTDDGPGVPENDRERIFDPLRRGSDARGVGGGVGLAVCRRIVEAHGGTLGLESAVGEGATFRFTLPRGAALDG